MRTTPDLLMCFYGDDFTGSTDAMESLAIAGVRTVLFTSPPTRDRLERYPDLQAFGIAGTTRSMPPQQMDGYLRSAFTAMREAGAPIVHYKVCSTFDSSPETGSIGRALDVGLEVMNTRFAPIVVGAPALGRYCVFGNLFARCGPESEAIRLDRHPSMSHHPKTPMDEADLRLHLAKQTSKRIGLINATELEQPDIDERFDEIRLSDDYDAVLIDLLYDRQLARIGNLLNRCDRPTFIVGSSGVEAALCAHWRDRGEIGADAEFSPVCDEGPVAVICGSRSPVTDRQVQWATEHGFVRLELDPSKTDRADRVSDAARSLSAGRSIIIDASRTQMSADAASRIGGALAEILSDLLDLRLLRRVAVAGGDTSGEIARELQIESLEMIGNLTRGAPLCRASAGPGLAADGLEITFKGGQIGPVDFFRLVRDGTVHA
jgi:uncharacterized protein YgbK (DUF1537 family)